MDYSEKIKDLVYYQWLLITGGAIPEYCKANIDRIMLSIPQQDWDSVKAEVEKRLKQ